MTSTVAVLGQILGSTVLGGGLIKGGDWLIGRRKNDADAAKVTGETYQSLLTEVDKRRKEDRLEYDRDLTGLRGELDALRGRERQRDIFADRHTTWDRKMAGLHRSIQAVVADLLAGRQVSPEQLADLDRPVEDPPPLYLPGT